MKPFMSTQGCDLSGGKTRPCAHLLLSETAMNPRSCVTCTSSYATSGTEELPDSRSCSEHDTLMSLLHSGSSSSLSDNFEWDVIRCKAVAPSSTTGKDAQLEVIQQALVDLSVETVNKVTKSEVIHDEDGAPLREVLVEISGSGLAPWEIHRPQQVVMELAKRGVFHGRTVLDAGCGIGDTALYLARYCGCREVTAFDLVPRALVFAQAKEGLRQGMKGKVKWVQADAVDIGSSPLAGQWFDVVLDVALLHCFGNSERAAYCEGLKGLVRPGGYLLMCNFSDKWPQYKKGGPRRISKEDFYTCFPNSEGWQVESVEDALLEHHPSLNTGDNRNGWPTWRGYAEAYLATIRRL